jgi:hypothetical protein
MTLYFFSIHEMAVLFQALRFMNVQNVSRGLTWSSPLGVDMPGIEW